MPSWPLSSHELEIIELGVGNRCAVAHHFIGVLSCRYLKKIINSGTAIVV